MKNSEPSIRVIDRADDALSAGIATMFQAMHEEMGTFGMRSSLNEGGADLWLLSISKGLERFGRLVIAEADQRMVGFAYASLKLSPDHLGGKKLGYITHLYVDASARGKGVGERLAALLHDWFAGKQVEAIELQVLVKNEGAVRFWRSLGYEPEYLQMSKR